MEAQFSGLSLEKKSPTPRKFAPVKVARNTDMVKNFLHFATGNKSWFHKDYSVVYSQVELNWKSAQYREVEEAFDETNEYYEIVGIDRVDNPFLLAHFLLKSAYRRGVKESTKIRKLFHGTRDEYVDSICRTNLDWRWVGSTPFKGNKYGNGVSFSPSSSYASRFPRGDHSYTRVMLLCNVLVDHTTVGNGGMMVPPDGSDATGSADGEVVVKYDDNEFYPKYVIYYEEYDESDDGYGWYY